MIIGMLYLKGPGSQGAQDPLHQRSTLGIKFLFEGKQYGAVLDESALKKLGFSIADGRNESFEIVFDDLVEGVPPAATRLVGPR